MSAKEYKKNVGIFLCSFFIYDMFYAELANHEYGYTGDITDTVEALGYTVDDLNADKRLLKGLKKAMDQFAA